MNSSPSSVLPPPSSCSVILSTQAATRPAQAPNGLVQVSLLEAAKQLHHVRRYVEDEGAVLPACLEIVYYNIYIR